MLKKCVFDNNTKLLCSKCCNTYKERERRQIYNFQHDNLILAFDLSW